ncbi:MAG: hypothetical protein HOI53_07605 [Francisellaceae bacterium]|jgi:hypothetical protein|nr:hypothetical protein [Francisellaceae bacterium]MBT6207879.1 hypothetical protein [Francisellaceae bacterium]MBT6538514.1 hypothetical protein [Francisellaceae bacterium]
MNNNKNTNMKDAPASKCKKDNSSKFALNVMNLFDEVLQAIDGVGAIINLFI